MFLNYFKSYKVWLYSVFLFFPSCREDSAIRSSDLQSIRSDTTRWPGQFGYGRAATSGEIASLDIDVRPDGKGLPEGSGDVLHGRRIYGAKCALCHGKHGTEGPYSVLVTSTGKTEKTIGNYWPYATTLFDYMNRAMPYNSPGSLNADEVYALTAFLLHANGIIDSTATMNAVTLPRVVMPAQNLFVADDRRGGPEVR